MLLQMCGNIDICAIAQISMLYVFHKSKGFFTDSKLLIATHVCISVFSELLYLNISCIYIKLVLFSLKTPRDG